ncbi:MAG TPA: hypothetical protein VGN34_04400 [Ktedonobacteraceae bacterium]|jgi:hypothetical protein
MEDQVTSSKALAEQPGVKTTSATPQEESRAAATATSPDTGPEHRQAYGTAKTENLRDSGLWRVLLPGFIIICCLVVIAVPLVILIALLYGAITSTGSADVVAIHHQLIWLWVIMIILSLGLAALIIRYYITAFFSESGYSKA